MNSLVCTQPVRRESHLYRHQELIHATLHVQPCTSIVVNPYLCHSPTLQFPPLPSVGHHVVLAEFKGRLAPCGVSGWEERWQWSRSRGGGRLDSVPSPTEGLRAPGTAASPLLLLGSEPGWTQATCRRRPILLIQLAQPYNVYTSSLPHTVPLSLPCSLSPCTRIILHRRYPVTWYM